MLVRTTVRRAGAPVPPARPPVSSPREGGTPRPGNGSGSRLVAGGIRALPRKRPRPSAERPWSHPSGGRWGSWERFPIRLPRRTIAPDGRELPTRSPGAAGVRAASSVHRRDAPQRRGVTRCLYVGGRGKDATGDEVAAGGVRREARSAGSTSPPIVGGRGVRYGPAVLRVAHAPRACSTDRASRPDRGGPDRTPNQQAAPLPRRLSLARAQRTAGGGPAGRGSSLPNPAPTAPTWCGRRDHRRCPCAATR
jgi:hypothetical protein